MEAPGALEVTRFPGVIVPGVNVPVCAVKGVRATPSMNENPCVKVRGMASGRGRVREGNGTRVRTPLCERNPLCEWNHVCE